MISTLTDAHAVPILVSTRELQLLTLSSRPTVRFCKPPTDEHELEINRCVAEQGRTMSDKPVEIESGQLLKQIYRCVIDQDRIMFLMENSLGYYSAKISDHDKPLWQICSHDTEETGRECTWSMLMEVYLDPFFKIGDHPKCVTDTTEKALWSQFSMDLLRARKVCLLIEEIAKLDHRVHITVFEIYKNDPNMLQMYNENLEEFRIKLESEGIVIPNSFSNLCQKIDKETYDEILEMWIAKPEVLRIYEEDPMNKVNPIAFLLKLKSAGFEISIPDPLYVSC